jgi:O-antigen/teichoic acid export membrane protein
MDMAAGTGLLVEPRRGPEGESSPKSSGGGTFRVTRNAVYGRFLHGVAWNVVGAVVQQGGALASAVVVARVLGPQVYGRFALIQSSLIAMTTVASLALGVTATKFVSEYRVSQPEKAGRILGLASLVAITAATVFSVGLFLASAHWIPGVQHDESLVYGARVGAAYVFFVTLNGYQLGAVVGFESFRAVGRIGAAYGCATLLLSWLLTKATGLRGAVAAQAIAAFLLWLLYQAELRGECRRNGIRVDYSGAWRERAVLWHFSLPAACSGILASTAIWWCNAHLVRISGYTEMAVFTAVNTLRSVVLFVPAVVGRVAAPLLNRLRSRGDHQSYERTFWVSVAVNAAIALAFAVPLIVWGPSLSKIFGKGFVGTGLLVWTLLVAAVLEVVGGSMYQALFSAGTIWRNFGIMSVWAAMLTGVTVAATPTLGSAGIGVAYCSAWCLATVLYTMSARRQRTGAADTPRGKAEAGC